MMFFIVFRSSRRYAPQDDRDKVTSFLFQDDRDKVASLLMGG